MDTALKQSIGIAADSKTSGFVIYDPGLKSVMLARSAMPHEDILRSIKSFAATHGIAVYLGFMTDKHPEDDYFEFANIQRFTRAVVQICREHGVPLTQIWQGELNARLGLASEAKTRELRRRIIEMLGPVGSRHDPGPCFGVSSQAWRALGAVLAGRLRE